mmetsp:Transcript_16681/g.39620  ORF Transcript_16681/g.39620 Transcript_16681/m.39620 type:complete len:204 (-) Transcript_16681:4-615(-)
MAIRTKAKRKKRKKGGKKKRRRKTRSEVAAKAGTGAKVVIATEGERAAAAIVSVIEIGRTGRGIVVTGHGSEETRNETDAAAEAGAEGRVVAAVGGEGAAAAQRSGEAAAGAAASEKRRRTGRTERRIPVDPRAAPSARRSRRSPCQNFRKLRSPRSLQVQRTTTRRGRGPSGMRWEIHQRSRTGSRTWARPTRRAIEPLRQA